MVQSLILCSLLITIGVLIIVMGMLADMLAANRKILENIQYHVRRMDYDDKKDVT
jgi:hypothetical protein